MQRHLMTRETTQTKQMRSVLQITIHLIRAPNAPGVGTSGGAKANARRAPYASPDIDGEKKNGENRAPLGRPPPPFQNPILVISLDPPLWAWEGTSTDLFISPIMRVAAICWCSVFYPSLSGFLSSPLWHLLNGSGA